ncbi:MAG: type IV pilin protein [Candidatus Methylumidiphilus sp.]
MRTGGGFSLVELVVTITIVTILATVAIPSYQQFVRRAVRAEARATMLDMSLLQERFFTSCNTYLPVSAGAALTGATTCASATAGAGWKNYSGSSFSSRKYNIAVAAGTGQTIATSFLITATPSNGYSDAQCGSLSLDSFGTRGNSAGTVAECWK